MKQIIETTGEFVTRCGEIVTIESIDGQWAKGQYANGTKEVWRLTGRLLISIETPNDIVYTRKETK